MMRIFLLFVVVVVEAEEVVVDVPRFHEMMLILYEEFPHSVCDEAMTRQLLFQWIVVERTKKMKGKR